MADDQLAPGSAELCTTSDGKNGIKAAFTEGKCVAFSDFENYMQTAIARHKAGDKARSNESGEAEERAYVDDAASRLGLPKEAIL